MLGPTAVCSSVKVLIYLAILCVGPYRSGVHPLNPACHLQIIKAVKEYEYMKEGDIMIGGVMTSHFHMKNVTFPWSKSTRLLCVSPNQQGYRYLVDFRYAVEQTNKDPARLPNLTLGYHIYDSCGDPRKAVRSILQILSGTREPVPNYSCVGKRNIAGFIGDLTSETTVPIAQILTLYGYSQISYGATDPLLSDRVTFPYFFRTVQSDEANYFALGKLLSHFGWTWVGIITSDDISGEREHHSLAKYLSREGVCIEFTIKINTNKEHTMKPNQYGIIIQGSSTGVIIISGTASTTFVIQLPILNNVLQEKTLILSSNWGNNNIVVGYAVDIFNYSLVFVPRYHYDLGTPEMSRFLEDLHPSKFPEDELIEDIFLMFHSCLSKDKNKNELYKYIYGNTLCNCTGQERITELYYFIGTNSPRVHLAVDIMSQALHEMLFIKDFIQYPYKYQLHRYLKKHQYSTQTGPTFLFDEHGEYISGLRIYNYIISAEGYLNQEPIGEFLPWESPDQQLNIISFIEWKTNTNEIPRAQCSDNCLPGFRKAPKPGAQSCCYDCVPCSEGEISNTTDSESCIRCPDVEWPNEEKSQCIAKMEEFLSYSDDVISVICLFISVLFFLITEVILGVFIKYQDTPIVRANNRSLSFLLLVSIKLSFLSVFLFLGRPVDITCMLRIITFGITFSIAVSSLLAKTIMVCVAFKATKPGSSWRKWLGVKLSNSVVLFCSSIQIIICMTWLAISPPFQELDIHTSPGTIIIQCNEGSAIGFYSVIGYMGLLAAVSFVLAFLARSLPDSFNEAKYITFSMLLFCSVWITMIPAYLSTKGKNTVCVEIFAILTSSAGLLASIFLPKCYTILLRPELNIKTSLLRN
ncbi:vomeronasal type-2 receptor 26 [Xenopus tropicalis]|uniref:Vomeronasal type-2 receptor 26 n=1 Tax=Xenopus tropicalis TaxID=8364 RepID=A0A8J0SQG7_XENTR|nr:vomeronasal type-2 receptor 26 [Xenopus tropicalis]|eukprot:XP_017945145.1 PREDICTED: vomeronasal type-2 receptor 26-like [Xenopus tropicalis]